LHRFGVIGASLIVGFSAVPISITISLIIQALWGVPIHPLALILPGVLPLALGTPALYAHFRLAAQLERSRQELQQTNASLERVLADVKELKGLLPICSSCKKVRDDQGYWSHIEIYIRDHSKADFSHGLCPQCYERLYGDLDDTTPPPGDGRGSPGETR